MIFTKHSSRCPIFLSMTWVFFSPSIRMKVPRKLMKSPIKSHWIPYKKYQKKPMFPVISPKLPRLPELLAKLSLRLRKVEGESAQVPFGMAMSGCSAKMVIWCDCISRAKIRDSTWFLWNKPRCGINLPSIDPVVSICIHVFTVDMFDPWAIPKNIIGLTHHPSDYPMTSPANAHRIQVDGRTAVDSQKLVLWWENSIQLTLLDPSGSWSLGYNGIPGLLSISPVPVHLLFDEALKYGCSILDKPKKSSKVETKLLPSGNL